jgi:hypothetical protein
MHNIDTATLPAFSMSLDAGWAAAECVGPDGAVSLWLISPDGCEDNGCACTSCAPHDQRGSLPRSIKQRVGLTCQGVNLAGVRCSHTVRPGQDFCHFHASQVGA